MKLSFRHIVVVFAAIVSFSNCAKKGTPEGGPRDSIPPVIVKSSPENFSINFEGDEIRINFDEYIKLKDLQQNLIVSPPMKYQPIITPYSTSKVLKIQILDTLKENTTYSFNFGNSIVDNNEENPYEYYKYVFSTGTYIDSLTLSGRVQDSRKLQPDGNTTLLLYELTEDFNDSLIYTEKPTYITTTRDTTQQFEFTNLKEGEYLLLALKEKTSNYTFQPDTDQIGFVKQRVSLPTDSTYVLTLFKEELPYELARPSHVSKNRIQIGYYGNADSLEITPLSEVPEGFTTRVYKEADKDTLNYWFKPEIDIEQTDTLQFWVRNGSQLDTLIVRMRDLYADSLTIKSISGNTLKLRDTLKISATTPLLASNADSVAVMNKDSVVIPAQIMIDERSNLARVLFEKEDDQLYNVQVFPGALTDFFEESNDTLALRIRTRPLSDYGTMRFTITNLKRFPAIIELVDIKYQTVEKVYLTEQREVYLDYLLPGQYYLRITYDDNENGVWDTGNFEARIQPEETEYLPGSYEMRPFWDVVLPTLTLPEKYLGPPKTADDPEE